MEAEYIFAEAELGDYIDNFDLDPVEDCDDIVSHMSWWFFIGKDGKEHEFVVVKDGVPTMIEFDEYVELVAGGE